MEKKTKKLVTIIGSILLGLSLTLNVVLGVLSANPKGLSGSVNESWKQNDVWIFLGSYDSVTCYSADGDYIHGITYCKNGDALEISYRGSFSIFDDLEVYFILQNSSGVRYTTEIETFHTPGSDTLWIPASDIKAYDLYTAVIIQCWIRTVD